jgi:uncharacterized protein YigE (DUF2233 family)
VKLAALALAVCLLAGCDEPQKRPNVDLTSACHTVSFEGSELTHCIADPAQHRITTALGPQAAPPYRSFRAFAEDRPDEAAQVAFAMNGGMYGEDGRPIGYYVEHGKRLHNLNRGKGGGNFHLLPNGVFFGTGASWAVLSTEEFARDVSKRPEFATQSGPMLVINGKLHPKFDDDGESRNVRNAVGIDDQGRAHFVISEGLLSFGRFARYFRDELKVKNALFLDGNVSALWDAPSGRMDQTVPLGPLIVVKRQVALDSDRATTKADPGK